MSGWQGGLFDILRDWHKALTEQNFETLDAYSYVWKDIPER
jgi:hypothetical protein